MADTDSCRDEDKPCIEIVNHYEVNVGVTLPYDANYSISLHNEPVTLSCEIYNDNNFLQEELISSLQLEQSFTSNSIGLSDGIIYDNKIYSSIVEYAINPAGDNNTLYLEVTVDEMTTQTNEINIENYHAPEGDGYTNQQEYATEYSLQFLVGAHNFSFCNRHQ